MPLTENQLWVIKPYLLKQIIDALVKVAHPAGDLDVIVDVILIAHMRPPYIEDRELLDFEREDMKRRNSLHEEVEKRSTGDDDSHVWG